MWRTARRRNDRFSSLATLRQWHEQLVDGIPIGLEVVVTTQVVVIHPGNAGLAGVDPR
jgi:hypothetical protein